MLLCFHFIYFFVIFWSIDETTKLRKECIISEHCSRPKFDHPCARMRRPSLNKPHFRCTDTYVIVLNVVLAAASNLTLFFVLFYAPVLTQAKCLSFSCIFYVVYFNFSGSQRSRSESSAVNQLLTHFDFSGYRAPPQSPWLPLASFLTVLYHSMVLVR